MRYDLVIFDLDGTLTEELLDFSAIRGEIGLPPELPILEQIAHLSPAGQARAHAILDRHELAAAQTCRLQPGAREVLTELRQRGVCTALLTRNSTQCACSVLARHDLAYHFSNISTRDNPPYKPHADSILNITRRLSIPPARTLMVGDYLYDLQAAAAAKVDSALLCLRDAGKLPCFAHNATYVLPSLRDLLNHVFLPQANGDSDR